MVICCCSFYCYSSCCCCCYSYYYCLSPGTALCTESGCRLPSFATPHEVKANSAYDSCLAATSLCLTQTKYASSVCARATLCNYYNEMWNFTHTIGARLNFACAKFTYEIMHDYIMQPHILYTPDPYIVCNALMSQKCTQSELIAQDVEGNLNIQYGS